jgi:hypothetical protein
VCVSMSGYVWLFVSVCLCLYLYVSVSGHLWVSVCVCICDPSTKEAETPEPTGAHRKPSLANPGATYMSS